jgi:hypothetical protein
MAFALHQERGADAFGADHVKCLLLLEGNVNPSTGLMR